MTDRKALRSMLIYAQREAEVLNLPAIADLLSRAIDGFDEGRAQQPEHIICPDVATDNEFYGHFASRRLQ